MDITDLKPSYFSKNSLKFSTIQSFKGLEAPVILVLDVDCFEDEDAKLLNYTAFSRAIALLYIFYPEELEAEKNREMDENHVLLDLIKN